MYLVQIVVKVGVTGTQIPSKQSGVRCENRGNLHLPRSQNDQPHARLPLVEVCHYFRRHALGRCLRTIPKLQQQQNKSMK